MGEMRTTLDAMRTQLLGVARVVFAVAAVLALPALSFAQVKVLISGGFSAAYREVLPEFERTTGISVSTVSGASQGSGADTIEAQLRRGVLADVVIMNRGGLAELIAQGRIVPGTDVDLAHTLTGMAVRAGQAKPDISTVDAFRQALLGAKVVATSGSNTSLVGDILPRLGIADLITVKVGRYTDSIAMVARGDAALVILPVSEILGMPGVEFVGTIPTQLQLPSVYAAAIVAGSKERDTAQRLIAFLFSERATAAIKRSGMEPSQRR
jgi:molybdate transport system substrate-binding protein